jgi:hypothetical protein
MKRLRRVSSAQRAISADVRLQDSDGGCGWGGEARISLTSIRLSKALSEASLNRRRLEWRGRIVSGNLSNKLYKGRGMKPNSLAIYIHKKLIVLTH